MPNENLTLDYNVLESRSEIISIQSDNEIKNRVVRMTIKLDEWSPTRYNPQLNGWYREKLDPLIFKNQGDLANCKLRSFLDHKMDGKNLVGWNYGTKPNMIVKQDGNTIIADLTIDESNKNLKAYADKVEMGVITSNSFIFQSFEREIKRNQKTKESPAEIIYKSGELISIDGVFQGFFPQASATVLKALQSEPLEDIKQELEKEEVQDNMINDIENKQTTENVEKQPELVTKQDDVINDVEKEESETVKMSREAYAAMIASEAMYKERSLNQQKEIELISKASSMNSSEKIEMSMDEIMTKVVNGIELTQEERQFEIDFIKNENKDPRLFEENKAIGLVKHASDWTPTGLDGTSSSHGLSLARQQYLGIQQNLNIDFPEIKNARFYPVQNFDSYKIDIIDPKIRTITPKAEGEKANVDGSSTTTIVVKPDRYAEAFYTNQNLNDIAAAKAADTAAVLDSFTILNRGNFYKNMVAKVYEAYNPAPEAYTGGLRDAAIVNRPKTSTGPANFIDMDFMINNYIGLYGPSILKQCAFYMSTTTFNNLENLLRKDQNKYDQVFNPSAMTYKGIPIIHSPYYKDQPADKSSETDPTYPIALLFHDTKIVIGFKYRISDSTVEADDRSQLKRYINTRGLMLISDWGRKNKILKIPAAPARAAK